MIETKPVFEGGVCVYCERIQRDWPGRMCQFHSESEIAHSAYHRVKVPNLKEERESQNLTVEDLAYYTKISIITIRSAESGNNVYLRTAEALSRGLEVPLERLTDE